MFLKKICKMLGFIRKNKQWTNTGIKLIEFKKNDGSFDYERYKKIQTKANKENLDKVWTEQNVIELISKNIILKYCQNPQFGICHGTRAGYEQKWFNEYLKCKVVGTEISDTAKLFENTVQWDFHEIKNEWIDSADFIYSNSFDHSYNPEKCLNAWINSLKKGGICIIEHTKEHTPEFVTEIDPFGADLPNMIYLITLFGKGKFFIRDIVSIETTMGLANMIIILKL